MSDNNGHECHRCGRCCFEVGRTFWKVGNLNFPKQFGNIEELNNRAADGDHEDNGLPCEMLVIENGQAVCLIEKRFGRNAKPPVCKDYPFDNEPCFYQESMAVSLK